MSETELIARVCEVRDWMLANAAAAGCEGSVKAHLEGWNDEGKIKGWIDLYGDGIAAAIPGFDGSQGIDFGCWTGFGTWVLSTMGARRAIGVELNRETMDFGPRWAAQFGLETVAFACNVGGVIPMPSRSMDWVYVNQVFCNMRPDGYERATSEIARVLRSGGRLVFCDSNNPHCPQTRERLERIYRTRELGTGDAIHPDGVLFKQRIRRIEQLLGAAESEVVERLARNTCYLGAAELDRAILGYAHARIEPASPFVGGWETAPVNPATGMAAGNVTDPFWFAARFESLGLEVSINTHPAEGPSDPLAVHELMKGSQGFYILGTKR